MVEVADIFRQYSDDYRSNHKLPLHILKTMSAIEDCRTARLGGYVDECDHCGYLKISYNSCRNRHCLKCQWNTKEKWIEERKNDLLPVKYYHMVFTIPDTLYGVTFLNQKIVYDILFRSVSETLLQLGRDPKHLGASIGFTAILHTWGQNLLYHPRICGHQGERRQ